MEVHRQIRPFCVLFTSRLHMNQTRMPIKFQLFQLLFLEKIILLILLLNSLESFLPLVGGLTSQQVKEEVTILKQN